MSQEKKSVGITETFIQSVGELVLENGSVISPLEIAYETYGQLNSDKSNAILVCHALSGDAHAAGYHKDSVKPGWWEDYVGPGKAFDTDKYYIISTNVIGGCKGSSGPLSINPKTGKPYSSSFPFVSISDMVNAQKKLIEFLGIEKLYCVAGGSMGGMQVLQWAVGYPGMMKKAICLASAAEHSAQQIAFNEVGRQAIMYDPN
ncbi:MAG TPA: alpha/beta fold hydrolase, partial [Leptospiraceae bacterium]|nr:alpha/beta fold hydrolase [Leptospiraceae bacterium]